MCRFIVYKGRSAGQAVLLGDLIVKPTHGIIQQSFDSRERFQSGTVPAYLNGDGFGVGWYALPSATGKDDSGVPPTSEPVTPTEDSAADGVSKTQEFAASSTHFREYDAPGVFTSISPAWNNMNLFRLSEKIRSSMIFAHVRAASIGSVVMEPNCHPFTHGRYLFMHNGFVSAFDKVRRRLIDSLSETALSCLIGSTDSEHCFALFLTEVEKIGGLTRILSPDELQACVVSCIHQLEQWCNDIKAPDCSLLNFAVTDGRTVVISRYVIGNGRAATLYFASGSEWREDAKEPGCFRMMQSDRREHVVIVASERLTAVAEDWLKVPSNHLLRVSDDMTILVTPVPPRPPVKSVEDDSTRIGCPACADPEPIAMLPPAAKRRRRRSEIA